MVKVPPHLQREWRRKLLESGFNDQEDPKGRLKELVRRPANWDTKEETSAYYALLDAYLIENQGLTRLERKILEMHSEGMHIDPTIANTVYRSESYCRSIIGKHRKIILHRSMRLELEYEQTRLTRYQNVRTNVFYPPAEIMAAYEAWATSYSGKRDMEWDDWSDVRDGVPRGTNAQIRRNQIKDPWAH
jgi:hypothetical protein